MKDKILICSIVIMLLFGFVFSGFDKQVFADDYGDYFDIDDYVYKDYNLDLIDDDFFTSYDYYVIKDNGTQCFYCGFSESDITYSTDSAKVFGEYYYFRAIEPNVINMNSTGSTYLTSDDLVYSTYSFDSGDGNFVFNQNAFISIPIQISNRTSVNFSYGGAVGSTVNGVITIDNLCSTSVVAKTLIGDNKTTLMKPTLGQTTMIVNIAPGSAYKFYYYDNTNSTNVLDFSFDSNVYYEGAYSSFKINNNSYIKLDNSKDCWIMFNEYVDLIKCVTTDEGVEYSEYSAVADQKVYFSKHDNAYIYLKVGTHVNYSITCTSNTSIIDMSSDVDTINKFADFDDYELVLDTLDEFGNVVTNTGDYVRYDLSENYICVKPSDTTSIDSYFYSYSNNVSDGQIVWVNGTRTVTGDDVTYSELIGNVNNLVSDNSGKGIKVYLRSWENEYLQEFDKTSVSYKSVYLKDSGNGYITVKKSDIDNNRVTVTQLSANETLDFDSIVNYAKNNYFSDDKNYNLIDNEYDVSYDFQPDAWGEIPSGNDWNFNDDNDFIVDDSSTLGILSYFANQVVSFANVSSNTIKTLVTNTGDLISFVGSAFSSMPTELLTLFTSCTIVGFLIYIFKK